MFKKSYLKIGLVVVLLLTTFLSLSVLSQAAGTDDYTITVQYDTGCVAVKVYYNNGTQDVVETLQSGVPLSIENRDSADVTLELLLHDGYDVDVATDGETVYFLPDDLTYSFSSGLISDVNITVTTKPMVYDIKYIRTTEEGTANIGDAPATHTYNTVTKIPNPTNYHQYLFLNYLIAHSLYIQNQFYLLQLLV